MAAFKSETLAGGIRALAAGHGSTVVLLPGWPETAEAYADVIPMLAKRHSVLCLDPPGLGDSAPPDTGYDTGAISTLLHHAVRQRTNQPFHLVGHDVGGWIAYSWAAQYGESVLSLTLLDTALPGLAAPHTYPLPPELNVKLWQFSFNSLPELPELLTAGREREFIHWLVQNKSVHPERITALDRYAECYARPGAMARGFDYYRATPKSAAQNKKLSEHTLAMPVLALGGEAGAGESLKASLQPLASRVEGGVIRDCGHYVMEEQPERVAEQLLAFFERVEAAQ